MKVSDFKFLIAQPVAALICLFALTFAPTANAQEKKQEIKIDHADRLTYDETDGTKARKLIGNVQFSQDNAVMTCDSAYFFSEENRLNAYGNVHMTENDSVDIYGDSLFYDGNTKVARLRNNITMDDKSMRLTTHYLDYNRGDNLAYYLGGGKIVNRKEKNTLTSDIGYYYPQSKRFFFKDSVKMVNKDYTIECDTLRYNTDSEITYFEGPTVITSEENTIYCHKGFYDTKGDLAEFIDEARIVSEEQELLGDSIRYNRETGIGQAWCNVSIIDTTQDFIINGDYAKYNEIDSTTLVHTWMELIQISDGDSLYLHGDTLYSAFDTSGTYREIFAYNKVRFFKSDMQGQCDSLVFSDADSSIQMYTEPILWSDGNQITGEYIQINNKNGELHSMDIESKAFIISLEDSVGEYNQIKGKNMVGYFRERDLDKIDVLGNGHTVYYASEEDGKKIGLNDAKCSNMTIQLDSGTVDRIIFRNQPTAIMYPMKDIPPASKELSGFKWLDAYRPKIRSEIFDWPKGGEPSTPSQ